MMIRNIGLLSVAIALGIACGGSTTPPPGTAGQTAEQATPAASSAPAAASTPAPEASSAAVAPSASAPVEKAWKDKSHDEKLAVMKTIVMPKMKALFQAHDAKEFKDFSCATCHGPGVKEKKFDMPNAKLPKLSYKDGFAKHMKKDPKTTKFMMESVVPEMSKALGLEPMSATNKTGFGCAGCHIVAE